MECKKAVVAVLAAGLMTASQPAFASEALNVGSVQKASGAFGGLSLRLGKNNAGRLSPSARFQLATTSYEQSSSAGLRPTLQQSAFEFGLSKKGRANFYVAGQEVSGFKQRMGLTPLATALVVGGLAAGAVVVAKLADDDDDELNRYQCLLPEKELCR